MSEPVWSFTLPLSLFFPPESKTITLASHSYWKLGVAPMLSVWGTSPGEVNSWAPKLSVLLGTRTLLLRVHSKAPPIC